MVHSQYASDLIAVKVLIVKNKNKYRELPRHLRLRYDFGLSNKAFDIFSEMLVR